MPGTTIAVLMTCHNRRATTVACLERLRAQQLDGRDEAVDLRLFVVDDGSTDGTAAAVVDAWPDATIITADGHRYWCGGMRLAFDAARADATPFDHHLWLNDDTMLAPDALARLLATHGAVAAHSEAGAIVVGSLADPDTGDLSYGGLRRVGPLPFTRRVPPGEAPRRCATMHGNCVLISATVVDRVGNLDPRLTHGRGDIDYGYRAGELGCTPWVAPGYVGTCTGHPVGDWQALGPPLRQRLAALHHPKYAMAEKHLVARRHYGPLWFLSPLAVYVYIVLSQPLGILRRWSRRAVASDGRHRSGRS